MTEQDLKPASILVVDDDMAACRLLETILCAQGYAVRTAVSGREVLAAVEERLPDLILLDVLLPDTDGFEVTRKLKADAHSRPIPIILATVLEDRESRLKGLEAGANEFLIKPVDHAELLVRVRNQLKIKEFSDFLTHHNRILGEQVRERTLELHQLMEQTVTAIALTLEKRDPYAAGHQQRVARLAAAIAADMGLSPQQVEGIHFGALLHNIGTVAVPAEILNHPGKLSELQFALIQRHAFTGFEIVKDIPFPWPVAQLVLQHHERLDGSGYPQGLKGEQILLEARILAVADVMEAMLAYRPYRAALGMDAVLDLLSQDNGDRFDPAAVEACLRVVKQPGFAATHP
ncbi:MAG: response regulator [Methylococcaceae bacterium]|nr:response regulator [Methylococcaceae bacterium]